MNLAVRREKVVRQLDQNTYLLNGKVEIDALNEEYNFNIEEGDYETISGYVTFKLGRIPTKGESIKIDHYIIHILKSDNRKIDLMKLTMQTDLAE